MKSMEQKSVDVCPYKRFFSFGGACFLYNGQKENCFELGAVLEKVKGQHV